MLDVILNPHIHYILLRSSYTYYQHFLHMLYTYIHTYYVLWVIQYRIKVAQNHLKLFFDLFYLYFESNVFMLLCYHMLPILDKVQYQFNIFNNFINDAKNELYLVNLFAIKILKFVRVRLKKKIDYVSGTNFKAIILSGQIC